MDNLRGSIPTGELQKLLESTKVSLTLAYIYRQIPTQATVISNIYRWRGDISVQGRRKGRRESPSGRWLILFEVKIKTCTAGISTVTTEGLNPITLCLVRPPDAPYLTTPTCKICKYVRAGIRPITSLYIIHQFSQQYIYFTQIKTESATSFYLKEKKNEHKLEKPNKILVNIIMLYYYSLQQKIN